MSLALRQIEKTGFVKKPGLYGNSMRNKEPIPPTYGPPTKTRPFVVAPPSRLPEALPQVGGNTHCGCGASLPLGISIPAVQHANEIPLVPSGPGVVSCPAVSIAENRSS